MADGGFRFPQPGQFFYPQHTQQNHHQQRHLVRNGSPVNSGRGIYVNDTPSPTRSPAPQTSSHNSYNMYNQGHQQGQHVMMNGGAQQRYMQAGMNHKYQHHTQHHGQQIHHHQANHANGHGVMGHQHTFSSGAMSHGTPQFTPSNLHNDNSNGNQMPENLSKHWQDQLHLASESRQARSFPHHHCKKEGVISRVSKSICTQSEEETQEGSEEEPNRPTVIRNTPRQYWDDLDMSGQGLRTLQPRMFSAYAFLKKLYLDHNNLSYLDPMIGRMRTLELLDLSDNQLSIIPEEIGMLVNLKSLFLFDNNLHDLPLEIGHLFKLEMLGVEGNPLDDNYIKVIAEHGTQALITHLRESYDGGTAPNERDWLVLDDTPAPEVFTVLSYNVLGEKCSTSAQYGHTPSQDLSWEYRKTVILEEIKNHDADIVCLQEVNRDNFDNFFRRELAYKDYRGVFWPQSRAKTMPEKEARYVDGCATFFKSSKYICLDKILIDFAITAINRPDMKGEHDTFNRVMPRDHIAVAMFLENRMTGSRLIVANAHIFWDPAFADVKVVQVAILMEQISKQAEKWAKHAPCTEKAAFRHSETDGDGDSESLEEAPAEPGPSLEYSSGPQLPLVICGDFNSAIGSGVCDLIMNGSLPGNHEDLANRGYGNFTRDGMAHPFKLRSAYTDIEELSFTNYTHTFSGVIDYIFYSTNALQVRGLLGNVDLEYLRKVPGFPNHYFPSDHLALKAELSVKPRKDTKVLVDTNGEAQGEWDRRG